MSLLKPLIDAALSLSAEVKALQFAEPTAYIYNPLEYAWEIHKHYLELAGQSQKKVVFLGMNPGPFGMAQTGVPFGEIQAVKDWMGLRGDVSKPDPEHPKRPVDGLSCTKSEVSGRRLWGLFAERYPMAKDFFEDHFVANYCPLVGVGGFARKRAEVALGNMDVAMGTILHPSPASPAANRGWAEAATKQLLEQKIWV